MSTTTEQQPAPDYGEPWMREPDNWSIRNRDGTLVSQDTRCHGDAKRDRLVACVNACAGMADPAAEIQALRDAASCLALLVDHGHADDCLLLNRANAPCDCGVDQAEAALAKLKALA